MKYQMNPQCWEKVIALPACVADQYLKLASGQAVKVLLYLLLHREASLGQIAEDLKFSQDAVEEGLIFWRQVGVLSETGAGEIEKEEAVAAKSMPALPAVEPDTSVSADSQPNEISTPASPVSLEPEKQTPRSNTGKPLTPSEIAQRIEESDEIKFLFFSAEKSLCHLLNHTEQRSLLWMHDYLGLPADVILMLFEYCKVVEKTNIRYMEQVALSWQQKEILTHETADREIQLFRERTSLEGKVKNAFGLDRKLSSKEISYISAWSEKSYLPELIAFAYDKTIDAIGKLSFPYIDKILEGWREKGYSSREEVQRESETGNRKSTSKSSGAHSYNLDEIDQWALQNTPKATGGKQ